jgi:hypothetical protein
MLGSARHRSPPSARYGGRLLVTVCWASALGAAACSSLIGIDDAEVDPNLHLGGGTGNATGGSAGHSQSGGSAGTAGASSGGSGGSAGTGETGGLPGTGGSAGTAAGGSSGQDASAPTLCERYCTTVMTNCTEANAVYASEITCLAVCAKLAEGSPGDETGDTVECRITQAVLAETTGEPGFSCPAAGPGGNGVCGSNCEAYCELMDAICPSFIDASCLDVCEAVPDNGAFNVSIQGGNTIQCRFYHVSAATQSPAFHCPHAAGEAICVP